MKNVLILLSILLSGCSTIHFDNGAHKLNVSAQKTEHWHHNFALGLYEHSKPVIMVEECVNGQWQSVKTELSFINGLAAGSINWVAPIWQPKTVEVSCQ